VTVTDQEYADIERTRAAHAAAHRLATLQAQAATAQPSPEATALEEIMRLTRYQARVELRTFYSLGYCPTDTDRPWTTFHRPDPDDELAPEIALPYCVAILAWGVETLGATLAEAMQAAAVELREGMIRDGHEVPA